jgi:hypothetical protein
MNDAADAIATKLTDRQVKLLAAVSLGLSARRAPVLSYEEWCEAESLFETIETEETN